MYIYIYLLNSIRSFSDIINLKLEHMYIHQLFGPQHDLYHLHQIDPSLCVGYVAIYVCRIPREALHAEPTTFLLSIEGMPGLDWKRLCKLQCPDGSYMSSPAPTAYALMQTGDAKCFEFLDKLIDKFNGGGMDRRAHKMLT